MKRESDFAQQGRLADEKLAAAGLILTQGGEPTFIPHDTTAPEWNIAALGPEKLRYARTLAHELAEKQFKGGVILQSFGKQYPGEPLPRWQIGVYRSLAGAPLWKDLALLRADDKPREQTGSQILREFITRLASALNLADTSLPAYEDFEIHLQSIDSEESKSLLPHFSRTKRAFVSRSLTEAECETFTAHFEPAGWILPLSHDGKKWISDEWLLPEQDDLVLLPGDSPIGLRLPLSYLPDDALRRGLTVEMRAGSILIFLPPMPDFAAFTELVQTIEKLVVELDVAPIFLEGYPPPSDEDMEAIGLTSDPGVLEVNIPPADNWPDFERMMDGVFESTASVQMRSFKYQMSGRKVATGGGAHIVLGGPDIEHNPFIHKPSLLSSFLRFLQHHPSLSYAFSGLFIGPSSQAPRVDESAFELPYELEISLRAVEEMPEPGSPVELDAILRNLVMDWNGNTHRAEVSLDKFYNYNAPNGQHGLVEFRAFEMVPDAPMFLATNVMLRALAACFAERAFKEPLVDWREALHDRFALPSFLREDLLKVINYVNEQGFSFRDDMFDSHLDFRFPEITTFEAGGAHWALRQALEPWPVMGEHEGSGRIVDSTTDRLELLVEGLEDMSGLVVSVNGWQLPLTKVSSGKYVAGIRYRLFDNPWGLQPQIKAHSPLQLRIVDESTGKIVYALDYENWKVLGEQYEGLPKADADARLRVSERLRTPTELIGTEQKSVAIALSAHAPYTLDLRRCEMGK